MKNRFASFLDDNYEKVDKLVALYYDGQLETHASDDMGRYLYVPLAEYSANGGKRHRPLVCLLACAAVGGDPKLARSASAAIEHFHTAALIHDDIADDGEMRHGKPCLHITEGIGLAINDGDLALSQVTGIVLRDKNLSDPVKIRVLDELVSMTTRTIEGQALDIGWARDNRWDITVEDYLTMARHKTAYYSVAVPLACGAIIGGGDAQQVEALREFGMATGLAFQIQDDLLNLVGASESIKKDYRTDLTEGKRTLMVVYALANADEKDAAQLRAILSSHTSDPEELERAVDIMRRSGALDYARNYSLDLVEKAKASLAQVKLESKPRSLLLSMADFFVERIS